MRPLLNALTGLAFATLCGLATAQTASPLKVGVIGPFTGPSADFGVPMLQGVQLAVAEINGCGYCLSAHSLMAKGAVNCRRLLN